MTDKKILNNAIESLENLTELLIGCEIPEGDIYLEAIDKFLKQVIPRQGNKWQPIETVRNDIEILVLYDFGGVEKLILRPEKDYFIQACDNSLMVTMRGATHWMPLPKPPERERTC